MRILLKTYTFRTTAIDSIEGILSHDGATERLFANRSDYGARSGHFESQRRPTVTGRDFA